MSELNQNEIPQGEYNAFEIFSHLRDEAVATGNKFQDIIKQFSEKSGGLTAEEQAEVSRRALNLRTDIAIYQYWTDAAYKFEQITSGEGFTKQ
jgi:hypothetical protein